MIAVLRRHWVLVIWTLIAVWYVGVIGLSSRDLTFYWDEWSVLWAWVDSPWWGLLQGNGGNFFPLSRAVFGAEVHVFGTWYPGYTMFSASVAVCAAYVISRVLPGESLRSRLLAIGGVCIYLGSSGVLVSIGVGFMLKWVLATFWAAAGAWCVTRLDRRWRYAAGLGAVVLIGLTFSTATPPLVLLMTALIWSVWVHHRSDEAGPAIPSMRHRLSFTAAVIVVAAAMSLLGQVAVSHVTSIDPADHGAYALSSFTSTLGPSTLVQTAAGTFAWLASALLGVPLVNRDLLARLVFGIEQHPILAVIVGLLIAAMVGIIANAAGHALRRTPPSPRFRALLPPALMGSAVACTAAFFAVTKPGALYYTRYMAAWVMAAALTWVFVAHLRHSAWVRKVAGGTGFLLGLAAVGLLVALPWTFRATLDAESPRTSQSTDQGAALERCVPGGSTTVYKDVAQTMNPTLICRIYLAVRERSLL